MAISLESGILLYSKQFGLDDFGLGGGSQDPFQLAATLFALYSTAKDGAGSEELKDESAAPVVCPLSFVRMGDTVLYFREGAQGHEGGRILTVASFDARFSSANALELLVKFSQKLASHGLSTTSSPRQSTLKAISREFNAILAQTAKELLNKAKTALSGNSTFVLMVLDEGQDGVPDALFTQALVDSAAREAGSKETEVQKASPTPAADLIKEITKLYTKHNPAKLPDLPHILSQWVGREETLLSAVKFKYEGTGEGGKVGETLKVATMRCGCLPFFSQRTRVQPLPVTCDSGTSNTTLMVSQSATATVAAASTPQAAPAARQLVAHILSRGGPSAHARGLDAFEAVKSCPALAHPSVPAGEAARRSLRYGLLMRAECELRVRPAPAPAPGPASESAELSSLITTIEPMVLQDLEGVVDVAAAESNSGASCATVVAAGTGAALPSFGGARDCLRMRRIESLLVVREARADSCSPAACGEWGLRPPEGGRHGPSDDDGVRDSVLLVAQCLRAGIALH